MKIVSIRWRVGDLSKNKQGVEVDKGRVITPSLVYAGDRVENNHLAVIGLSWWKWGIRLIIHLRLK